LIQKTRHLDSIVARSMHVADFIDSIGQKPTFTTPIAMSAFVPITDIGRRNNRLLFMLVNAGRPFYKKRESLAPRPAPPVSSCSFSLSSARDFVSE
jgi:hypothetical protein